MSAFSLDLYGQEPESRLLAALLSTLANRKVVDVGAERGSFARALLDAGADEVYVIEPEPHNVATLRVRFSDEARVHVRAFAVSSSDGELVLHRSTAPSGELVPFGHTVLKRPETQEIVWRDSITVAARSLGSLAASSEIPSRIGVLKIDTEGHDLAVVRGIGDLEADVVMVEHWLDLPDSLGRCPWTGQEVSSAMRDLGFSHFALVVHHGEFTTLQWDDTEIDPGKMGNLVFLHDRVLDGLIPDVLACASELSAQTAGFASALGMAAAERLAVVEHLSAANSELVRTVEGQEKLVEDLRGELEVQVRAAAERREALDALGREYEQIREVAADRLATIERLTEEVERARLERDELDHVAIGRLQSIEELRQLREENERLASAAAERLALLERLAEEIKLARRDRDDHARVAEERLALIERLERERDTQTAAAADRLKSLEKLQAEADLRQHALDELAAQRHFG